MHAGGTRVVFPDAGSATIIRFFRSKRSVDILGNNSSMGRGAGTEWTFIRADAKKALHITIRRKLITIVKR